MEGIFLKVEMETKLAKGKRDQGEGEADDLFSRL
jgi:hypothetical protein